MQNFFYNFYGFPVIHANFRLRDNNGCIVRQQWKSNDVLWLSISIPLPYHDSHWWQGIKWCSIVKFCIAIQQIKFKVNWSCAVCNFCNIISKMWNNMRKQMKFSQSQPQYQNRSGSYAGGVQADCMAMSVLLLCWVGWSTCGVYYDDREQSGIKHDLSPSVRAVMKP